MINKNIKHPFKVPDGYFDNLENSLLSEINILSIEKIEKLPVPNAYFDNLEDQILSEINLRSVLESNKTEVNINYFENLENAIINKVFVKPKKINVFNRIWINNIYRSAAAILLIGSLSLYFLNSATNKDQFADISSDEIVTYLENQALTYNEISQVIDDQTINKMEIISSKTDISEQDLLEYLEENEI